LKEKVKMGCRKTGEKRQRIKPMSEKYARDINDYRRLKERLLDNSHGKSELSGNIGMFIDLHHIEGRTGGRLTDPFNVIVVTREEHEEIHKHNSYEKKQELLARVKEIRLSQGYKTEDYNE
jgi:hypothetical protein